MIGRHPIPKISLQIDAVGGIEDDAFGLQAGFLFLIAPGSGQADVSSVIDDPVPGKAVLAARTVQDPSHLPGAAGSPGQSTDAAVGTDLALGDALDNFDHDSRKCLHGTCTSTVNE